MNTLSMTIDGMSCGHCVTAVRKALEAARGVEVEEVTIGSASVRYDPGAASVEAILAAVADEGYEARITGGGQETP